jgi:hypothetical protein
MMSRMTDTPKKSWYRREIEKDLLKTGEKAHRKGKLLKVHFEKDLAFYLEHGWEVVSHQQRTYVTGQHWLLKKVS